MLIIIVLILSEKQFKLRKFTPKYKIYTNDTA
jgi:hypothetical protein